MKKGRDRQEMVLGAEVGVDFEEGTIQLEREPAKTERPPRSYHPEQEAINVTKNGVSGISSEN